MRFMHRPYHPGLATPAGRSITRKTSFLSCAIILVSFLSVAPALFGQVPRTTGRTLDGADVSLPNLFRQQPVVLVLGFSQKSSEDAKTWSRKLIQSEQGEGRNDVYGIILLSRVPHLLRGLVIRSIRKDVSASVQSRFVTVDDSEQEWRELANVTSSDDVYVLVLNYRGTVCWRAHGPYSDQMLALVKESLKQARADIPKVSEVSQPEKTAPTKTGTGSAGAND